MAFSVGDILEGKVTGITNFGVFVELEEEKTGMVHISEVASTYVKDIKDYITMGQTVKVKVLNVTEEGKISLSIKKASEDAQQAPAPRRNFRNEGYSRNDRNDSFGRGRGQKTEMSFEDMMNKFKQTSDDKMNDLKRSVDMKRGTGRRRGPSQ